MGAPIGKSGWIAEEEQLPFGARLFNAARLHHRRKPFDRPVRDGAVAAKVAGGTGP